MKIAVLFDNFGPYHLARLQAASGYCDLLAVEFGSRSGDYEWHPPMANALNHAVVNSTGASSELSTRAFRARLSGVLEVFGPQVVVVPGWASRGSLLAVEWAKIRGIPVVIMSESTRWDEPRVVWKEAVKRRVVKLASAALVGGTPHAEYIHELGLEPDQVIQGYDVVDNDYFACEAEKWREQVSPDQPSKYFLSSNRFIQKKNLTRLLDAYAAYCYSATSGRDVGSPSGLDGDVSAFVVAATPDGVGLAADPPPTWNLCMLGDGELREKLLAQCAALGLQVAMCAPWEVSTENRKPKTVYFPGFRQIDELPRFYGQAGAFVHASSTEQWGLVVNEAMASGLPVIVSDRVGCASDLVSVGFNGFTFDYRDVNALTRLMTQVSTSGFPLAEFGSASLRRIAEWGPDRFGKGLKAAAEIALSRPISYPSALDRILLAVLIRRSS